jgi:predicted O-linked N-acetylglucosamine transferase (SPINDLY family)
VAIPHTHAQSKSAIRVGFLSSFFSRHSVGRLLAKIIIGLQASNGCDVFLITPAQSNSFQESDDIVTALNQAIPHARRIQIQRNLNESVESIRSLQLNLIVFGDIFMVCLKLSADML